MSQKAFPVWGQERIGHSINWLIRPLHPVHYPETRRRMQILTGLVLILIAFLVMGILLVPSSDPTKAHTYYFLMVAGLILLIPVYFISRTSWYMLAVRITLALTSAFPFLVLILGQDFSIERIQSVLIWLIISFLLGVSLLSIISTLVLIGANLAAALALPLLFPAITYATIVPTLGLLLIVAVLILANVFYRNQLENDQRIALTQEKEVSEESRRNLRALLNAYTDTAFLIDPQGKFIALNQTTAREFKRTVEQLTGTSAFALLSPALAETRLTKINQAIATRQPVRFIDQGRNGWFDNTIFPILGADGTVTRLAIYARDITEFITAEQKLAESEAKFRNIVESSPMGMHLYKLEDDGRLVLIGANPAANSILGIDHKAYIGKTIEEAFPNLAETEVPTRYRAVCISGEPWFTEQITYRDSYIDGAFEVHAFQTAPGMMAVLFLDVTERKRTTQAMQQRLNELVIVNAVSQVAASQLDLQAMIELTGEKLRQIPNVHGLYIALHDPQHNCIRYPYWRIYDEIVRAPEVPANAGLASWVIQNRQALVIDQNYMQRSAELGVVRRRLADNTDKFPQTWIGIPMQIGDQVIGILSIQNFEHEHAFTENDLRLWKTIAANIGIAIQNAQLYDAVRQELDERQKLIAELETKNAELEQFTYTVSHDLKSPLITIQGYLGFIEQDAKSGNQERMKADIERITQATRKMNRLLTELLELSRIGRVINPSENVPFDEIVQEALSIVQGQLDARHIRVTVSQSLPVIHGDRARLVEVVQNLVDNAAKFTSNQPQPHIEIGWRDTDPEGKPIFFVRDNGIGIEPCYQERIFGLFNKLDTQTEGTGVGLALVKRIVQVHGGNIWVESEGLGKGSTFCFTLATSLTQ
jgi:PAS domain S-box-containing protein